MTSSKSNTIISKLENFFEELKEYQAYLIVYRAKGLKQQEYSEMIKLREKLVRKTGRFTPLITELTSKDQVTITKKGLEYSADMWQMGLRPKLDANTFEALSICMHTTNRAIGKLESDIEVGHRDIQGNLIKPPQRIPSDISELPIYLFDRMQLHPRIRRVSKSLFNSGHYAEAIFAAFKAVNNFTKKKAGLSIDGKDLMAKTFNEDKPIIKLNKLSNQSERDEQEGFRFLFMGAMVGIRNPKAHEDIRQIDPYKALEYLSFASLLMRRATEGKLEIENK